MNDLVIPGSRIKLVGQFVGGVVFAAVGWFLMFGPSQSDPYEGFVGLVTLAFFGTVAVSILYHLVKGGPAIVINADGIVDNSSGVSVGLIPWDHVGQVREYRVQGQVFLSITPKNLDALLKKQPRWKRAVMRANLSMGAGPVNIPQAALGIKVSDLIREIEQRRRAALEKRSEASHPALRHE
jgi:hypothetical protein